MPIEAFAAPAAAGPQIAARTSQMNRRRSAPVLRSIKELAERTKVYIFNLGPWQQPIMKGAWRYFVAPRKPGDARSEPIILAGIVTEEYPDSEKTMKLLEYDGWDFAWDLLGVGIGMDPMQALTRYGLFVSKTNPPTGEDAIEEEKARERLNLELNALVNEANAAYTEGPVVFRKTVGTKGHHWDAAKLLQKSAAECPWLNNTQAVGDRIACPFCGTSMPSIMPRCPNSGCGEIVNQEAYAAAKKRVAAGRKVAEN